jgi:uncharacterized protein YegL
MHAWQAFVLRHDFKAQLFKRTLTERTMVKRTLEEILAADELTPDELKLLPTTEHVGLAHLPVVILLDTSNSTARDNAIVKIAEAINGFIARIANPPDEFYRKLRRQGDFCIIRYGGVVEPILPWTNGSNLDANRGLHLAADGNTPMGQAIVQSADLLLDRYRGYKSTRTRAFCGLVFNLTDGEPTDMAPEGGKAKMWNTARERIELFEEMGSAKNPYAQYVHFSTHRDGFEVLRKFAGDRPLYFPSDEEVNLDRVNLLEGANSFERFIRYIEMSLNKLMDHDA